MEQVIYSSYEYPIGNRSSASIFAEYKDLSYEENSITVGGINVAIRAGTIREAVVLTYDKEADTFMRLKMCGIEDVVITRFV